MRDFFRNNTAFQNCLAFAVPFLAVIAFETLILNRPVGAIGDPYAFHGIGQGERLLILNPDFWTHYPAYFVANIFAVLNLVFDPLKDLSVDSIIAAWIVVTCLFVISVGVIVGRVAASSELPISSILLSACMAATMSSMIRSYSFTGAHYMFGVALVGCAILAYAAVKSEFSNYLASKWLFLLCGFTASLHYGSIFMGGAVFGAYFWLALQKKTFLLFKPESHKDVWQWFSLIALVFVLAAVISQVLNLVYLNVGKLSYAAAITSLGSLAVYFYSGRRSIKKMTTDIGIVLAVQALVLVVAKGMQIYNGHPSIIVPHVLLSIFPSAILVLSFRTQSWFEKIKSGPIGIAAIGVLVSGTYGVPFLLEGVIAASRYYDAQFGVATDFVGGVRCALNWDIAVTLFSISILVIAAIKHQKFAVKILSVFALLSLVYYLKTTVPGTCTFSNEGTSFGWASRIFLLLLFFGPFALMVSNDFSNASRRFCMMLAVMISAIGLWDYAKSDLPAYYNDFERARTTALKLIEEDLLDPDTQIVCKTSNIEECVAICEPESAYVGDGPVRVQTFRTETREANKGNSRLWRIDKVSCGVAREVADNVNKLVMLAPELGAETIKKGWTLRWSAPPSLYIYEKNISPANRAR